MKRRKDRYNNKNRFFWKIIPPAPLMGLSLLLKPATGQAVFDSVKSFQDQKTGVPVHITRAEESGCPDIQRVAVIE